MIIYTFYHSIKYPLIIVIFFCLHEKKNYHNVHVLQSEQPFLQQFLFAKHLSEPKIIVEKELRINISLVIILVLLFTGMVITTDAIFMIKFVDILFSAVLMLMYVGMADSGFRKKLSEFNSPNSILGPVYTLAVLLVLFIVFSAFIHRLQAVSVLIMAGYFLLPLLLVLLHRKKENTFSIWFFLAIVAVWFANDLKVVPDVSLPISGGVSVPKLMGVIWLMYLFLVYRELENVGFTYNLKSRDFKTASIFFGIFIAFFALPIGISTGFISSSKHVMPVYRWPIVAIGIMFFIAVIEEFIFRGLILNLVRKTIHGKKSVWIALIASSVMFGFAHADHHKFPEFIISLPLIGTFAFPWVYVLLATVAGIFYGLTYIRTGKITAAALTHCLVDTLWRIFLKG